MLYFVGGRRALWLYPQIPFLRNQGRKSMKKVPGTHRVSKLSFSLHVTSQISHLIFKNKILISDIGAAAEKILQFLDKICSVRRSKFSKKGQNLLN